MLCRFVEGAVELTRQYVLGDPTEEVRKLREVTGVGRRKRFERGFRHHGGGPKIGPGFGFGFICLGAWFIFHKW